MRCLAMMATALLLLACGGGSQTGPDVPDEPKVDGDEPIASDPAPSDGGPSISAEVGSLDKKAVAENFEKASSTVKSCFDDANDSLDMPIMGGDVEVVLRVKHDGSLRWAYAERSTVGHAKAERCILDAMMELDWPKPSGGEEGIARTTYGMDAPARPPVQWSLSDLGSAGRSLESKLKSCRRKSGTSYLSVTLYVDTRGRVMSAGAAVGDDSGLDSIDCAISAAKRMKFRSPGSYPAKATVEVH